MATHYGILAWKTPCTEESGELQSMGSQRVGRDGLTEHRHAQKHDNDTNFTEMLRCQLTNPVKTFSLKFTYVFSFLKLSCF